MFLKILLVAKPTFICWKFILQNSSQYEKTMTCIGILSDIDSVTHINELLWVFGNVPHTHD